MKCLRVAEQSYLAQFADRPTREITCLDFNIRHMADYVEGVATGKHFGESDHKSAYFRMIFGKC